MNNDEMREYAKKEMTKNIWGIVLNLVMTLVAVAVYIFLGKHYGSDGWKYGWLVFLIVIVVDSLINAIKKKKPSEFAYAVLATFIFLVIGFFFGYWHPAWVVFLTVPVYYAICDAVKNIKKRFNFYLTHNKKIGLVLIRDKPDFLFVMYCR